MSESEHQQIIKLKLELMEKEIQIKHLNLQIERVKAILKDLTESLED